MSGTRSTRGQGSTEEEALALAVARMLVATTVQEGAGRPEEPTSTLGAS
jgi:hypothetical protein